MPVMGVSTRGPSGDVGAVSSGHLWALFCILYLAAGLYRLSDE